MMLTKKGIPGLKTGCAIGYFFKRIDGLKPKPMNQEIEKSGKTVFELIRKVDVKNNEWWSARELGKILEYSEYRHFKPVIEKAKEACKNSGQEIENHFEDFLEMVKIGSGAERPMEDGVKLSRYACYLIVQNADPTKEVVAHGQTYFAGTNPFAGNSANG